MEQQRCWVEVEQGRGSALMPTSASVTSRAPDGRWKQETSWKRPTPRSRGRGRTTHKHRHGERHRRTTLWCGAPARSQDRGSCEELHWPGYHTSASGKAWPGRSLCSNPEWEHEATGPCCCSRPAMAWQFTGGRQGVYQHQATGHGHGEPHRHGHVMELLQAQTGRGSAH